MKRTLRSIKESQNIEKTGKFTETSIVPQTTKDITIDQPDTLQAENIPVSSAINDYMKTIDFAYDSIVENKQPYIEDFENTLQFR